MDKRSNSKLAEWLERLQQESWQLELLVSGFAIFLLMASYEPLIDLGNKIFHLAEDSGRYKVLLLPYSILIAAWFALFFNLIIHVLFRGLWISTIGLRYVSDDIDFEYFRFAPKFDRFLRKRIGSFDRYIERLEKVCSIIFAFTFLVIFMVISFGLFIGLIALIDIFTSWLELNENPIISAIKIFLFIAGLVYFADFVTLGRIKRIKWFSKFYYPIYRFFGWITLCVFYRPMYYNLIDNKFGRWVGALLVPYIVLSMVLSSVTFVTHGFFPEGESTAKLNNLMYDDIRGEKERSDQASIPSKYISNGYLELFLPYNPWYHDKLIDEICPNLTRAKETGPTLRGIINIRTHHDKSRPDSLLMCMSQIYELFINDSLLAPQQFFFYEHPTRKDLGLLTHIDIHTLERGPHTLKIKTLHTEILPSDSDTSSAGQKLLIPFWKE